MLPQEKEAGTSLEATPMNIDVWNILLRQLDGDAAAPGRRDWERFS